MAIRQDVTSESDWDTVVAATVERFGRLDILVNNVGACFLAVIAESDFETWRRQLSINLDSVFLGCRAAVRQMLIQGGGGAIVNISSIAAMVTGPGTGAYSASKAGVNMLAKTLALELAEHGIRVNSVHPGMIATALFEKAARKILNRSLA